MQPPRTTSHFARRAPLLLQPIGAISNNLHPKHTPQPLWPHAYLALAQETASIQPLMTRMRLKCCD